MSSKPDFKTAFRFGSIAGTLALMCCISPVVMVLLGLSTTTAAIALGDLLYTEYTWFFMSASALFLGAAFWAYLIRQQQCSLSGLRRHLNTVLLTLVITVVVYSFWFLFTSWLEHVAS